MIELCANGQKLAEAAIRKHRQKVFDDDGIDHGKAISNLKELCTYNWECQHEYLVSERMLRIWD